MTAVPQRNRSQVPLYGALPAGKLFALGIVRSKETHSTTSACISFSCLFRPAPVPARASPVHLTTLPLQNSTPRGSRYHILAGRFTPAADSRQKKQQSPSSVTTHTGHCLPALWIVGLEKQQPRQSAELTVCYHQNTV